MEKVNVISLPFYKFKADDALTSKILDTVANLNFTMDNNIENGYSYHDFYDEELFAFFDKSIKQVKKIYYKDNLNFPIVDCWVNKYSKLNKLKRHMHSNSMICGVFYLTSHEDEGSTIFELPNPWYNEQLSNLSVHENYSPLIGEIKAEAGTLMLFPSNIFHTMKTLMKLSSPRYTIAFNTFAIGNISDQNTTRLSINVSTVKDRVTGNKN
jgi:hypothetical protein